MQAGIPALLKDVKVEAGDAIVHRKLPQDLWLWGLPPVEVWSEGRACHAGAA
jgi:hypothetical protein